jgi:Acetyltransferase (GNAT) domain
MKSCRIDITDWNREPGLLDEIVNLQRQAFVGQGGPISAASIQTADYYRWKYESPHGIARLTLVRDGTGLVAMAAAVPITLEDNRETRCFWQLCDIATRPDRQRGGLFGACLKALTHSLAGEPIFCIPNRRSRTGLRAAGFQLVGNLDLWIWPIRPFSLPAWSVCNRAKPSGRIFRQTYTADTFAWRFKKRPGHFYRIIETTDTSGMRRFSVIYPLRKSVVPFGVLLATEKPKGEPVRHVLYEALAAASSDGLWALLYLTSDWRGVMHEGFVRVPNAIVPRGFPIVALGLNDATLALTAGEWDVL